MRKKLDQDFLMMNKSLRWKKLGLIYEPDRSLSWSKSHAQVPTVLSKSDGSCTVYFSSRAIDQRSYIGSCELNLNEPSRITDKSNTPILSPGAPGMFDFHGVYPSSIIEMDDSLWMYYIGYLGGNQRHLFYAAIGLAISRDGGKTFHRFQESPIMDKSSYDPCFVTAPTVVRTSSGFMMYYLSCFRWFEINGVFFSYYDVKIATSSDGLNWHRDGRVALELGDATNYSRVSVIKDGEGFCLWTARANPSRGDCYKIGIAKSIDGLKFSQFTYLDIPDSGSTDFDRKMSCYPFIVEYEGRYYMFYNGNELGREGFGLAVSNSVLG